MSVDKPLDVIVIGGGIAGASAAALLSETHHLALLEMEERPAYHTTGRSAAMFLVDYGIPSVRAVTASSLGFFEAPPDGFCEGDLLQPRGGLLIAKPGQEHLLDAELANTRRCIRLTEEETRKYAPRLKDGICIGGVLEAEAADIDVDLLHQAHLRLMRQNGGRLITNAELLKGHYQDGLWHLETKAGPFSAPVLVNAAGAWGDVVAERLGVSPIGLLPKRRSIAVIEPEGDYPIDDWPLTAAIDSSFYVRPQSGRLLVSPADETPSEPCDAWAEDMDLALGIDQMQQMLDIEVKRLERSWAGLRTFTKDGGFANGFDAEAKGFYWLVGQGGYGIQSSPGMAAIAASQIRGEILPESCVKAGVDLMALDPGRFR